VQALSTLVKLRALTLYNCNRITKEGLKVLSPLVVLEENCRR